MSEDHQTILVWQAKVVTFNFIKEIFGEEEEDLVYTLQVAYEICNKNDLWKFFMNCPPPSHHGYLWWHPEDPHYEEWEKVYNIFKKDLIDKFFLKSWEMNFHMKVLKIIANEGWDVMKKKIFNIRNEPTEFQRTNDPSTQKN